MRLTPIREHEYVTSVTAAALDSLVSFGLRHRQYHDLQGWLDFVDYLEHFWLADMPDYLKEGELAELVILTEHQQFTINRSSLRRFWRRKRTLRRYLDH